MIPSNCGDKNIVETIIIVIADGNTHAVEAEVHSGGGRNICEARFRNFGRGAFRGCGKAGACPASAPFALMLEVPKLSKDHHSQPDECNDDYTNSSACRGPRPGDLFPRACCGGPRGIG